MMTPRRNFLKAVGGAITGAAIGSQLAGCASFTAGVGGARKKPRNILFLMTDQHLHTAMGHAGDRNALTPTLDALAESGTAFNWAYCQDPVCVPSRNSILMGRYSRSTGAWTNSHNSSRDFPSFPSHLRSKGYKSACCGKLHVHGRTDIDWDVYKQVGGHSTPSDNPDHLVLPGAINSKDPLGAPHEVPEEGHSEWHAKEDAIAFMKEHKDVPWVLQCSMNKPHPAFQPPQKYWDMIDRSKLKIPRYPEDDLDDANPRHWSRMGGRKLQNINDEQVLDAFQGYYGNIAFCDAMFGEVLDALDELGLRDETLIVYTADHGEMLYRHRLWTKFCFYEESVHVPLIMSLPGWVPADRRCEALIELVDLFPTFMDLLEFDTPETVQGKSFLPTLTGETETHRDFVRAEFHHGRDRDNPMRMQFDGRFKFIDNGPDTPPELFDLKQDPQEIENIAGEPRHQDMIKKLTSDLREWGKQDVVATEIKGASKKGR